MGSGHSEEVKDPLGTATELRGVGGREFDVLGLRLRLTSSAPDVLEAAALASRHVLVTAAAFLVVALTAAVVALVMVMRLMADAHSDFLRVLRARGASGGAVWWVGALIRLRVVGLAVVAGVVTVVLAARYGLENGRWVSLAEAGRVVSTISSLELSGTDLVARVATLVGVVAVTSVVGLRSLALLLPDSVAISGCGPCGGTDSSRTRAHECGCIGDCSHYWCGKWCCVFGGQ